MDLFEALLHTAGKSVNETSRKSDTNINVVCTHQAHDLPQRGAGVEDWRHVGGVVADHARDPAADALHHLQLLSVVKVDQSHSIII